MAVYEHLYKEYDGAEHTPWSRFLVIPRYAIRDVFKSKLFTSIFILCFIYPLIAAILVYLRHNVNAIALLQINVSELLPIDNTFFRTFLEVQGSFCVAECFGNAIGDGGVREPAGEVCVFGKRAIELREGASAGTDFRWQWAGQPPREKDLRVLRMPMR